MGEHVITVSDLRVRYRGAANYAVDGITFDVAKGEIFGFLGPNGAGKSTTQRVLTRLLREKGAQAGAIVTGRGGTVLTVGLVLGLLGWVVEAEGDRLSEYDLISAARLLMVAGHRAPTALLANGVAATGVDQIHFAAATARVDSSTAGNPRVFFGGAVYPPEDRFEIANLDVMQRFITQARPQGGSTK